MKIEKENMTVEDTMDRLIETKDGITCDCGNSITTKFKRSEEDLMMY